MNDATFSEREAFREFAPLVFFDSIDGTQQILPSVLPEREPHAFGVLSPDGAVMLRTVQVGPPEDRRYPLFAAETATIGDGLVWRDLSLELPGPLRSNAVWIDASTLRAPLFEDVIDIRLVSE